AVLTSGAFSTGAAVSTWTMYPSLTKALALLRVCEPMPPPGVSGGYSWETRQTFIVSHADLVEHSPQHDVVTEILAGHVAGSPAMAGVIRIDLFHGGNDVVHAREGEQAPADRQEVAEAGLLGDHGPARGQILCAPFAEPAAPEADIL